MLAGDLAAERIAAAAELREVGVLIESMKAEVGRAQAREEEAAARLVTLRDRGATSSEVFGAAEEYGSALERRASMTTELATLEAKQVLLGRIERVFASAAKAPPAAAATRDADAVDDARLLRAVMGTQEEERRRIARAVHDGPAQAMANVVLQSEISERAFQVSPESSKAELAGLRAMVNRTLQELRGFIFELRPMILDDLGLVPTLRRYVQTLNEKHGATIELTSTGRDRRLRAEDEVAIFRLIQEALIERVARAGAKQVTAGLDWRDDSLEVHVQSDGAGSVTTGEMTSGLTRAERLGLLGGTVEESRADGRVELAFHLPIAAATPLIT